MTLWDVVRLPILGTFRVISRINLIREFRFVFIFGHMRSGSTLLAHILASHPDFVGAGEMHIRYQKPEDLSKLVLKTCEYLHRPLLRQTYVVDQINHDLVSDEVLRSDQVHRFVLILRQPEATLQSMMNLAIWHEKGALEAYVDRLQALTDYGLVLGERALLVEYDDLVDHTEETLAELTRYFDVNPPFTPDYATHKTTGKVGDPSGNISSGRIVRTPRYEQKIRTDILAEADQAYRKCRNQLLASGVLTVSRAKLADARAD